MIRKENARTGEFGRKDYGALALKRFVTARDLSFRAGFFRLEAGHAHETFYWYSEFHYVIEGSLRYTYKDRNEAQFHTLEAVAGDAVFVGLGTQFRLECISSAPSTVFYVAIPASAKGREFDFYQAVTER